MNRCNYVASLFKTGKPAAASAPTETIVSNIGEEARIPMPVSLFEPDPPAYGVPHV
ncbi:hypothetical protein GCM10020370_58350 [Paenibacillus hodogayensis]